VRVRKIGLRLTTVRTKTGGDLLIPNAELVQAKVSNFTYRDPLHRIETQIGVAYSSDLKQVRSVLEKTCDELDWKVSKLKPQILLAEFAGSSVNYSIRVWIDDPWMAGQRKSDLNEAIWWALKEAGIVIAFPQRDVHLIHEHPTMPVI
jgi:small-conductance mechanosensitive channel